MEPTKRCDHEWYQREDYEYCPKCHREKNRVQYEYSRTFKKAFESYSAGQTIFSEKIETIGVWFGKESPRSFLHVPSDTLENVLGEATRTKKSENHFIYG